MDRTALPNKIRHLLNKTTANGCTEAEAATALKQAERLMAEHDIAIAEAFEAGDTIEFNQSEIDLGPRLPGHFHDVAFVVQEACGVHVVFKALRFWNSNRLAGYKVIVFGEASKLDAATWTFGFLSETFKGLWTRFRVANRAASGEAAAYYLGLKEGFLSKLRAEKDARPASGAIVKVEAALDEAFREAFPDTKIKQVTVRGGQGAFEGGFRDGREINLARPVEQGARTAIEA